MDVRQEESKNKFLGCSCCWERDRTVPSTWGPVWKRVGSQPTRQHLLEFDGPTTLRLSRKPKPRVKVSGQPYLSLLVPSLYVESAGLCFVSPPVPGGTLCQVTV